MFFNPICSKCKSNFNINLTIHHDCIQKKEEIKTKTEPINNNNSNDWDIEIEKEYFCYNPFKKIHLCQIYHNIEYIEDTTTKGYFYYSEQKRNLNLIEKNALLILKLISEEFFFKQYSSYDNLFYSDSYFKEDFLNKLEKNVMNFKNPKLEPKILEAMKLFILDIYCLILVLKKTKNFIKKEFLSVWINYDFKEYKNNIIKYFKEYVELEENVKNNLKGKDLYFPQNIKFIYYIDDNLFLVFNSQSAKLYNVGKNKFLCSIPIEYNRIKKISKINKNNFLIIEYGKLFIINIEFEKNYEFPKFKVVHCFNNKNITDADIINEESILCIDDNTNKNIYKLKKNFSNEYFIEKQNKIINIGYCFTNILADNFNNQFLVCFDNSSIILIYDINNLILKKSLPSLPHSLDDKDYKIKILNKELYIYFSRKIVLISSKYLEVVSVYENFIKFDLISLFPNSLDIFLKFNDYIGKYIFHYYFDKNELKMQSVYYNESLIDLQEINNRGDYMIFNQNDLEFFHFKKCRIRNNKFENYNFKIYEGKDLPTYCNQRKNSGLYSYCTSFSYCISNSSFSENTNEEEISSNFEEKKNFKKNKKNRFLFIKEEEKYKTNKEKLSRGFGKRKSAKKEIKLYDEIDEWVPYTNLGRLTKLGYIRNIDQIFYHSIPIKEYQIVDFFLNNKNNQKLNIKCFKIQTVQNHTRTGQKIKYKVISGIGDENGHIGIGIKTGNNIKIALKRAIIDAKLNVIPVKRGFFKDNIGSPHTIGLTTIGKCCSVKLKLIPAPKGIGINGSYITKELLKLVGIKDIYIKSFGNKSNIDNYIKAIFNALYNTNKYLTPDLWNSGEIKNNIIQKYQYYIKNY